MKKKILFVIPEYSHGGTNKSLENLLHFLDTDKYSVSIYSLYEDGGKFYKDLFKPYIVKKSLAYYLIHDNVVTRKIAGAIMRLFPSVTFGKLYQYEANRLQKKHKFQTVIAFQEGTATQFVALMENVPNKVAWVHCDYANRARNIKRGKEFDLYSRFDKIASVSKYAVASFVNVFPQLRKNTICVYNTIDTNEIFRLSEELRNPYYTSDGFILLSVGRFVRGKQFYKIPEIVEKLTRLTSCDFCWYIIGDGADMNSTIEAVNAMGLQKYIKILGAKDNPYPYFKYANLHVCTSASESFSYTIAESKILHVPVLCNDFPVSSEVVSVDEGWICNIDDMAMALKDIIEDKNGMYSNVKNALADYEYPNEENVKMVNGLF